MGDQLVVPSARSTTSPSVTIQENAASTVSNTVEDVLKITKEASDLFKGVPYVKALAGVILQIIKIREVRVPVRDAISSKLH